MRKIISILIALLILMSFIMPASATPSIVSELSVTDKTITIKGNTGYEYDDVNITLLNPGVDTSELGEIDSREAFLGKIAYADIVKTNICGDFELTIEAESTEDTTLYITNSKKTYIRTISNSEGSESIDNSINFVDYRDGKILFKGISDLKEAELKILILKEDCTIDDYIMDKSKLYSTVTVNTDTEGRYEAYADNTLEDGKKYNAYVVESTAEGGIYKNNMVVLQNPAKIYVSKTKTGNNVFSTIEKARDYLRTNLKNVPVDVIIDGGEYRLAESIKFTEADKRETGTRVKYKSAGDEEVVLNGGYRINAGNFKTVTDETVLSNVYDNIKGKLVEIDLAEEGVPDEIIKFTDKYNSEDIVQASNALTVPYVYLNGEKQELAKWPNNDFADGYYAWDKIITYNDDSVVKRWETATDMFVKGYFGYTWQGEWLKAESVSFMTINLTDEPKNGFKLSNPRFAAVNLIEEIDVPGEWFIDKESNKLYYYPPHKLTSADVFEIGGIEDDIININSAENLFFEGLTIEKNSSQDIMDSGVNPKSYDNGIEIIGSNAINIYNCIVRNVAAYGITTTSKSTNVWIDNCRIYNTGLSGIWLTGQNKDTLKSTGHIVSGSHITDVSLNSMNAAANGIYLDTTGALVENNTIHNVRTNAIRYIGSENIIRNNEIYLASTETADSGAIYTGRRWDSVGNVSEKNYIHNIGPKEFVGHSVWYIYYDDSHAGNIARNNILVGRNDENIKGIQIAQGPNNVVESNTFVNFGKGSLIELSYRDGFADSLLDSFETIPYNDTLYMMKYPYLANLGVLYNPETNTFDYTKYHENNELKYNIGYNSQTMVEDKGATSFWINQGRNSGQKMTTVQTDNRSITEDAFVNSATGDYRFKDSYDAPYGVLKESGVDLDLIGMDGNAPTAKKFDLLYPANGELHADTTTLITWEKSYDADCYTYTVATDKGFGNIVASGDTDANFAEISGLSENTIYYWKVQAKTSARVAESWDCEEIFVFATYADENAVPEISYGNISAKTESNKEVTELNGEKIIVTDEITSLGLNTENVVYIFAAYDDNGNLVYTKIKNKTVFPDSSPVVVMEFVPEKNIKFKEYKIFRWESFKTLKPIK
ncbi:MAG: right-handed parallel beta-helix repeat-containing protein [Clostridia bacterium]|nr:right-handed parallel beta-helix repeat-containing protein [Clostridia bacterium]